MRNEFHGEPECNDLARKPWHDYFHLEKGELSTRMWLHLPDELRIEGFEARSPV